MAGVGQKKMPPSRGDGHFATKAVQSYGVFACGEGVFLGVLRGLCGVVWVAVGGFCVLLRYGHFASRKCSRKGGMA